MDYGVHTAAAESVMRARKGNGDLSAESATLRIATSVSSRGISGSGMEPHLSQLGGDASPMLCIVLCTVKLISTLGNLDGADDFRKFNRHACHL